MTIKMGLSRQVVCLWSVVIMIYMISIIQTVQIDVLRAGGSRKWITKSTGTFGIPPEQKKRLWMNVWAGRTGVCSVATKTTTQANQRHTSARESIQTEWKGFSLFPPKLGFDSISNMEIVPQPTNPPRFRKAKKTNPSFNGKVLHSVLGCKKGVPPGKWAEYPHYTGYWYCMIGLYNTVDMCNTND